MRVVLTKPVYFADGLKLAGEELELAPEVAQFLVAEEAAVAVTQAHAPVPEPPEPEAPAEDQAAEPPAKPKRRKE